METLELKHLAPYLPYNLKIQGQTHGQIEILSCVTESSVNIKGRGFTYGMWADIFDIKPILRPLEDLFKEEFQEASHLTTILFDYEFDLKKEEIPYLSWLAIRYLFENHFDVFGLIEKNLAININTIENG